jgi:unsaturated rhamnogalacturonyl hydrolase
MKGFPLKPTAVASLLAASAALLIFSCRSAAPVPRMGPWSGRMADSVLRRNPDYWSIDFHDKPRWEYTYGLVLRSILEVWESDREKRFFDYVDGYYRRMIDSEGRIETYQPEDYNIDRINPGKPLFTLFRVTGEAKYSKAIHSLRDQMRTHPRTSEGGFWHKRIYPSQMWLDGIYMASPFLAEYAKVFNEPALFDEAARQALLMEKYAREEKSGLLYHGWDESRSQRWADPVTGLSPHFWGRSMGWYAMAVVDILDFLPEDHPQRPVLVALFNRLATAVTNVQDHDTGLWFQVLDMGTRKDNYLESSASCMFVYALAKGVRLKVLHPAFLNIAQKGYLGILDRFIDVDRAGLVTICGGCAVAGLGGDPYRDGSFEYYVHEKVRCNDPKAVGAFILASLEIEGANR